MNAETDPKAPWQAAAVNHIPHGGASLQRILSGVLPPTLPFPHIIFSPTLLVSLAGLFPFAHSLNAGVL